MIVYFDIGIIQKSTDFTRSASRSGHATLHLQQLEWESRGADNSAQNGDMIA